MEPTNYEQNLFDQARASLEKEAGLPMRVLLKNMKVKGSKNIDYLVQIANQDKQLAVEVKKWAAQTNIAALIARVRQLPMEGILVADYINPAMAVKLKEENIQFFDAVGNAYINQPPVYIQIKGNKLDRQIITKKQTNRAFDTTGLKVIFGFLCDGELLNRPYRDIAKATGVALGTVGRVLTELNEAGFLIERDKGKARALTNKRKLLERWVDAFPEKLQPKLFVAEFEHDDIQWWKNLDLNKYGAWWGGEIAAEKYTKYLNPVQAVLYIPARQENTLLKDAILRKAADQNGSTAARIKIYRPFWDISLTREAKYADLVHPILVYAELLATGESRNIETAKIIAEQFIDKYIRED